MGRDEWINSKYFGNSQKVKGNNFFLIYIAIGIIFMGTMIFFTIDDNQSSNVTHRVLPGETLRSIAAKYYRNPSQWEIIYMANREAISNTKNLKVGQWLIIPEAPKKVEAAKKSAKPSKGKKAVLKNNNKK